MSDMKWQNTRLMKTELKAKRCERCSSSRSRIMTDVSEHLVEQTRQNGGKEEED